MHKEDKAQYEKYKALNFEEPFMEKFKEWYENGGRRYLHSDYTKVVHIMRKERASGMSVKQLSKKYKVADSAIYELNRGNTEKISLKTAERLINIYENN